MNGSLQATSIQIFEMNRIRQPKKSRSNSVSSVYSSTVSKKKASDSLVVDNEDDNTNEGSGKDSKTQANVCSLSFLPSPIVVLYDIFNFFPSGVVVPKIGPGKSDDLGAHSLSDTFSLAKPVGKVNQLDNSNRDAFNFWKRRTKWKLLFV